MNILPIIFYLLLALINLPFALDKKNKVRSLNWFSIGFNFGLMGDYIINNLIY